MGVWLYPGTGAALWSFLFETGCRVRIALDSFLRDSPIGLGWPWVVPVIPFETGSDVRIACDVRALLPVLTPATYALLSVSFVTGLDVCVAFV